MLHAKGCWNLCVCAVHGLLGQWVGSRISVFNLAHCIHSIRNYCDIWYEGLRGPNKLGASGLLFLKSADGPAYLRTDGRLAPSSLLDV